MNHDVPDRRVAMITGASTGLGFAVSKRFAAGGYRLAIVGRDLDRLNTAAANIRSDLPIVPFVCDVTCRANVDQLTSEVMREFGRLDVLVNNVGMSDRGLMQALESERLNMLLQANVFSALNCSQAALPMLKESCGQIVNIGSLAAKVAPRFLGGYTIAKHALAAVTQQMRLELRDAGVNVMLVSPGPIRRDDAGQRYQQRVGNDLPDSANRPAGGTRVKGLDPEYVAQQIYLSCGKRRVDVVLPRYLRPIIAIGHLFPTVGDRMLLWFTSNKD